MSGRFLWIEWEGKDSKIRRARVPFKEKLAYIKYRPDQYEILDEANNYLIFRKIPVTKRYDRMIHLVIKKEATKKEILEGVSKFIALNEGKILKTFIGNAYGQKNFKL